MSNNNEQNSGRKHALRRRAALLASTALIMSTAVPAMGPARAQDATWLANPGSGDFYSASNWNPAGVPTYTATFGASNTTTLTLGSSGSFGGWTFDAGASNYTFNVSGAAGQDFTGTGITINGGSATIRNDGRLSFFNASTAGSATITNSGNLFFDATSTAGSATIANSGILVFDTTSTAGSATISNSNILQFYGFSAAGSATITNSNRLEFFASSTADSANITNNGALQFYYASTAGNASIVNNLDLNFNNTSTAGSANITNNSALNFYGTSTAGSANIANNSALQFFDTSTAGNATITNGGALSFRNASTAGNATITNYSSMYFWDTSTAGAATLVNGGTVDFSNSTGPNGDGKLSAGSIAGGGSYILGANELTVGSNNLSTEVSGVISGSGSLVKTGTGTLMLSGANTYTGGTTISGFGSELWLGNTTGGVGSILGAVTVGSGSLFKIVDADTSGITTITNNGLAFFYNATSAGSATITNNNVLNFFNASTAGNATITNNANLNFYGSSSASNAAITNNYVLSFNNTATAGSATINSSNASNAVFTYFYDNSTAGSATITNGYSSYLNFFNNSTAGSASFTNNSYMYFKDSSAAGNATIDNNSTIFLYNNSTAGDAKITNNAGGKTYFYENATAGNAQLINNAANAAFDFSYGAGPNGDNKLSAGSIAGGGTFSLGANELTVGSNNLSTTVSGVIADGGANGGTGAALVKTGSGTLTLSGTNTYTGGTTFAGGSVSVSSDANLGDAAGGLTFNGGALRVTGTAFTSTARAITLEAGGGTFDIASAGNTFTVSQALTGSGGLTKAGSGTLILSGAHTYTGATTVNAGGNLTIQGSIASSTVTNNNGTLDYVNSATAGHASITNNGLMHFLGAASAGNAAINNTFGILDFYSASTAGNAVISNGGFGGIDFYGGSTAGSATIADSHNLYFFERSTAGNAAIINDAGGTVNFSNSTGPNGDNKLSAGSLAGGGSFVLGANELTVGSNNLSTEVDGEISGSGSLVKTGTGKLTLSGTNAYTGATIVDGGTLAVNGDISASSGITVNNGGALGGGGTVGNTTIASGGALAPGNSIGTLTVNGNLTFNAGSFYTVEVSPSAADRTNVTGTATLTGATVQAVALAGSFRAQTYTIVNATGGFGGTQFAGLTASSFAPGARNPHLTYDLNNVYLVLDPGTIQLPAGASGNQTSVAGGINKAVESGAIPPAGFDVLLNMSGAQQSNALNQVSGQPGAAGTQASFGATQQFMAMLDPASGHGGGAGAAIAYADDEEALGYASVSRPDAKAREAYAAVTLRDRRHDPFEARWGVWASGYGGASTVNGNASAGTSTTTSRVYGTVVGADYRVSPDTRLGFALGGAGFTFSLSDGLGGGRADLFQAGLYGRHTIGAAYVSASLAYGWQDVTTDRTVSIAGTDKLTANYKANTFAARVETGWRLSPWPAAPFGMTPYGALQVTSFNLPDYGETTTSGSGQFALSYAAQTTTNVRTELGARLDAGLAVRDGLLTLRGRLAWAHDSNTDRPVTAAFQALPGATFTVHGAAPAADSTLVSAGAEMKWLNGLSLAGSFEGEFSATTRSYAGKGTLRYGW